MGKILLGCVIGLVLGLIVAFFSMGAFVGAGAGAGIAVGLSSGVCATVKAAQELGIMSAEQVDEVLAQAARQIDAGVDVAGIVDSATKCDDVMARLKEAAAK